MLNIDLLSVENARLSLENDEQDYHGSCVVWEGIKNFEVVVASSIGESILKIKNVV